MVKLATWNIAIKPSSVPKVVFLTNYIFHLITICFRPRRPGIEVFLCDVERSFVVAFFWPLLGRQCKQIRQYASFWQTTYVVAHVLDTALVWIIWTLSVRYLGKSTTVFMTFFFEKRTKQILLKLECKKLLANCLGFRYRLRLKIM